MTLKTEEPENKAATKSTISAQSGHSSGKHIPLQYLAKKMELVATDKEMAKMESVRRLIGKEQK
jgi:hypothetical protein